MRCLALADAFKDVRVDSLFVIRNLDKRIPEMVRFAEHEVEIIDSNVSIEEDAYLTQAIANRCGANLMITDICHNSWLRKPLELSQYHKILRNSCFIICLAG